MNLHLAIVTTLIFQMMMNTAPKLAFTEPCVGKDLLKNDY